MAAVGKVVMLLMILALVSNSLSADPDMLQDVCVADLASGTTPSILFCIFLSKNPNFLENIKINIHFARAQIIDLFQMSNDTPTLKITSQITP